VAPSDRRRPISERRSKTEMTMMLATPTAPTSRATAPGEEEPVSALSGVGARLQRREGC